MSVAQKPLMQVFCGAMPSGGQQSAVVVQRSLVFEHIGTSCVHVPTGSGANSSMLRSGTKQKPPQQSVPLVQSLPSILHGSSAANARWLPVPSSWPGK